ncbi:MAG: Bug family tripartite tricarboxylate transporter substrate binding protein [Burkholderiaceae bacterium]|jgi:tripartite-type tricarboxylate transporter receptor subunit TctC
MKWLALLAVSAATCSTSVLAQDYPARPVRIIVAYQAGQGTDVATRFVAEQLSKAIGQSFFIENRAGAGGNVGTAEAARAAPDGYTLTMGTSGTQTMNPFLYASTGYDAEKAFEPIILVSRFPMVIAAGPSATFKSVTEALDAARANPKSADMAMPSTTARLVVELLKERTGISLFGVPYKGSPAAATDVLGGQLPLLIDTISAAKPGLASGKLRALAVTSAKPSALLPGVPTVAEQGVPGFDVSAWNALYAPKGTPAAVITRLNAEVAKVLAQPDTQQRLLQLGHEPVGGTPAELAAFEKTEREKWGPIIRKAGLKAD